MLGEGAPIRRNVIAGNQIYRTNIGAGVCTFVSRHTNLKEGVGWPCTVQSSVPVSPWDVLLSRSLMPESLTVGRMLVVGSREGEERNQRGVES